MCVRMLLLVLALPLNREKETARALARKQQGLDNGKQHGDDVEMDEDGELEGRVDAEADADVDDDEWYRREVGEEPQGSK